MVNFSDLYSDTSDYPKVELFASQLEAVYPTEGFAIAQLIPRKRPIVGAGLQLFGECENARLNPSVLSIQEPEPREGDDEMYARLPSWVRTLQKLRKQAMDACSERRDL